MSFIDKIVGKVKDATGANPPRKKIDLDRMTRSDISLPPSLEKYDNDNLRDFVKEEFDTFRAVGYKDKPLEKLREKEYHSLQVGLLLRYIKDGSIFHIEKIEDIIPTFIIYSGKKKIHNKAFEVANRFNNGVSKDSNLMDLEREIRWTPEDTAYLLMYISLDEEDK